VLLLDELLELEVFGGDYDTPDGTGVRDFIHVMDLAEGHVAAISYLPKMHGFETFNLGNGVGYTVLQMINSFESVTGVKIPYKIVEKRSGDISSSFATPTKANQILQDGKLTRTIDDMCKSAWNFTKNI
jgi:UDP-glucose 4-epimerase